MRAARVPTLAGLAPSLVTALATATATALALLACAEPAPPPPLPTQEDLSGVDASARQVVGRALGASFRARDVRFRVFTREGRERVDLLFAARPLESCGLPLARDGAMVWLRFPERTALEVGTFTEGFEVHAERPRGGELEAVHRGLAEVVLEEVTPTLVRGTLRACFAEGAQSCVGGRFSARPCLSRIDGRAIREPPGLDDDALGARP